jgi:hypothetical protein
MRRALQFVKEITENRPTVICVLVALATMYIDFATGREIRFPLLYLLPIGLAAWMGKTALSYAFAFLLPFVRVAFEVLWQIPELLAIESVNALIEVLALALYAYLVAEKAAQAKQMKKTIVTKEAEMQHIRAFTRIIGTTLQGRGISPGLEEGVALVYQPERESMTDHQNIAQDDAESELVRKVACQYKPRG